MQDRISCPILLARQAPKDRQAVPSWTLTVPSGWASHIWQALTYQGARPAGQRERRWTAMQQVALPAGLCFVSMCLLHWETGGHFAWIQG